MVQMTALCLGLALLAPGAPRPGGPDKKQVEELLKQLKSEWPKERTRAAEALTRLGPGSNDSIPLLIAAMKARDDFEAPPVAALALGGIGAAAVPALTEALKDINPDVKRLAARALKRMGPDASAAVPALVAVVKERRAGVARVEAIAALGSIGPKAKESVPALVAALKPVFPQNPLTLHAITALGQIGPDAREAVPELIKVLKGPGRAAGAHENKYLPLRVKAAIALGRIGPNAKAAVPALVELLQTKKLGPARLVAAQALGGIGPDAREAVDALTAARKEPAVRDAADRALARIKGK